VGLAVRDLTARPFSAEELTAVTEQMDGYGVHLLSFALYTHHRDPRRKLTEAVVFGRSKTIQQVMLETGDLADLEKYPDRELRTEIWQRGQPPKILHRLFARSTDSARKKEELISEVSSGKRQLQPHVTALICGETSCTRMDRKLGMTDDFGILPQLKKHNTRLLVSNNHSAFRRYECRERCRFFPGTLAGSLRVGTPTPIAVATSAFHGGFFTAVMLSR
jgi:hypothetical protein